MLSTQVTEKYIITATTTHHEPLPVSVPLVSTGEIPDFPQVSAQPTAVFFFSSAVHTHIAARELRLAVYTVHHCHLV
jgi:hypothetical protein